MYIYTHTHSGYPYKANIRVKATYTSSLRPPILVAREDAIKTLLGSTKALLRLY